MSDNIVTSDDVNPKPVKKQASAKTTAKPKKVVEVAPDSVIETTPADVDMKYIYFSCGHSYNTPDGHSFTRDEPIRLIPVELADHLLTLDNFRLPDQLELEEFLSKS